MARKRLVVRLTAPGFALLLFVLAITGAAARTGGATPAVRKLTYGVEPVFEGDNSHLRVSVAFQGDRSGMTRLLLPTEWSDGVDLYKGIRNLQAKSRGTRLEETKEPYVRIVHHRPNQRVSLTYEVVSQLPGTRLTKAAYHYPVLRTSYFYAIGQALWVYPDMPETAPVRVSLEWKNIPKDWVLLNSFGVSQPRQTVNTTLEKFRAGTFLSGDYRIQRIVMDGHPVFAVTRGKWADGADEKFNTMLEKLLHVMRDFWRSYDSPYYLVALLPTEPGEEVSGGEARTNSFSIYLPSDAPGLARHRYLLAHELFHLWNPHRLGAYENDRLYWFGEGVTDYYAYRLLLRSGAMSLEEYVAAHNSWIEAYYTSPLRALTVDEMVAKRRTSHGAEQLFYKKGYLLANHLDFSIRSKTHGQSSLDDVMRSLLRSSKPGSITLSEKRVTDALRPYLHDQGASDIEKYMNRGELVPVENWWGACASVEDTEYRTFDAGFDYAKSFAARVVSGVVPDSNAYQAGLRDGQKLVTWGIRIDDPKRQARITIVEGDTQRVLRYFPASNEAIRLPQIKLKQDLSARDRERCL